MMMKTTNPMKFGDCRNSREAMRRQRRLIWKPLNGSKCEANAQKRRVRLLGLQSLRPKSRQSTTATSRISRKSAIAEEPEELDLQALAIQDHDQSQPGPSTPPSSSTPLAETAEQAVEDPFADVPVLHRAEGELYLFDVDVETFVVQSNKVTIDIAEGGTYDYWLIVRNESVPFISVPLDSEMIPRMHGEQRAFMFTFTSAGGEDAESTSNTWCVKFAEDEEFIKWKDAFTRYMWEGRNQIGWAKAKADDQRYIESAYDDVEMEDVSGREDGDPDEEDEEDEAEDTLAGSNSYDEEDSESDSEKFSNAKGKNQKLTVGYKNDRSFVVRGDMIGVFKHTDDNKIKWQTSINRVSDLKGKSFTPKKVSLFPLSCFALETDGKFLRRSCCITKIPICLSWTPTTRIRCSEWIWNEERL